ncbi:uncharacterized protein LOC126412789 [Schistocerca serialis cubense]|uniref:uncharacterized protein LOC126412789 n=1 Tax=Schistocerca serialis cubense TaxID=2023355 RepID=UPI00214E8D51|nr:uncharacterized protein LOC126412789 [Schistocerca serialis cubense]
MSETNPGNTVAEEDVQELRARMKLIADADPSQYHNSFSLMRYLRAFKTVDAAFQAILKTNKWRKEYGVELLNEKNPIIQKHVEGKKARVLRHRDVSGRPIIYIPAKNHNVNDRDIEELTKFIVFCLEDACKRCFEEVIDNLCIIFDLKDFGITCMDYQLIKNLIWLLSKHYPERLGICLILNAPAVFSTCWPVIRGWLDENTSRKVKFVDDINDLSTYLIPDVIPENM